jgi:hypothetical protein
MRASLRREVNHIFVFGSHITVFDPAALNESESGLSLHHVKATACFCHHFMISILFLGP